MWRKCKCGNLVLVPRKTDKKSVKCNICGASAPLKKRNGRVRGLKGEFSSFR